MQIERRGFLKGMAVAAAGAAMPSFAPDATVSVKAQKLRTGMKNTEDVAMVSFPVAQRTRSLSNLTRNAR